MTGTIVRVAIDGPSGVGKTTSARALAAKLGALYVDTGAMYRALALKAKRAGISPDDEAGAARLAGETNVNLEPAGDGAVRVLLDGEDVTGLIRTPEISDGASRISVHGGVRKRMVALQQALARGRSVVMEGRDIGTRVLTDAEVKVFLTATPEERARRRWLELKTRGEATDYPEVLRDIQERDARDSGRAVDPLRPAEDAVLLDGTDLDLDAQVDAILAIVRNAEAGTARVGQPDKTGPESR